MSEVEGFSFVLMANFGLKFFFPQKATQLIHFFCAGVIPVRKYEEVDNLSSIRA